VGLHLHLHLLWLWIWVELLLHMVVPLHMLPLLPGQLMLVPMSLMMKSMPHMSADAIWGIPSQLFLSVF
jgi:hypothetical protein